MHERKTSGYIFQVIYTIPKAFTRHSQKWPCQRQVNCFSFFFSVSTIHHSDFLKSTRGTMKTRPVWTIIRYFISICSFIYPYYLYNLLGSFSIDSFLHRPILISKAILEDVITIYILLYMDVCVLYKYTGLEYWPVTYILKNPKK